MGKIGKISVIPKDYSTSFNTMDKSLRQYGRTSFPGTSKTKYPYRELDNSYRTGLDENASYLKTIKDEGVRQALKDKIVKLREFIQSEIGDIDLSPRSKFWNNSAPFDPDRDKFSQRVQPAKLIDGDNEFNLDDPMQALQYAWLCAHPTIASSLEAYERGEYPADTHFYVNDEDHETRLSYKKNKSVNEAIIKFDSFSLEKRRKVARLMGIKVDDDAKESVVYNLVDAYLKAPSVTLEGPFKGRNPVDVFAAFANLKAEDLEVRDIVEQAFLENVYRIGKGGKVYEGENVIFQNKNEVIEFYLDEENQRDLVDLEKKIKFKKYGQ